MNEENYSPCTTGCDPHNPLLYDGVSMAVLICADANPDQTRAPEEFLRRERVLVSLARLESSWKVLCIPACMCDHFSGGAVGQSVDISWHQQRTIIVVANSDPNDVRSFVTNDAGRIVASSKELCSNEVVVVALDELRK